MSPWILIALVGASLSVVGMITLVIQYRRGELTRGELALLTLVFAFLVGSVVWTELRQQSPATAPFFVVFLPVWFVIVRRARQRREAAARGSTP